MLHELEHKVIHSEASIINNTVCSVLFIDNASWLFLGHLLAISTLFQLIDELKGNLHAILSSTMIALLLVLVIELERPTFHLMILLCDSSLLIILKMIFVEKSALPDGCLILLLIVISELKLIKFLEVIFTV